MSDPLVRSVPQVPFLPPVVPPPEPAEAAALAVAARYLGRAGTQAASRLLDDRSVPGDAALLAALRDQLLAGAALCDGVLDLARGGGGGG